MSERVKIKTDEGDLIGVLCCESNRGQSEAVLTQPLVVLAHGLAGYKEEGMLQCVSDYFRQYGLPVLCYDARHGLGESGGDLQKACFTEFIRDLNAVLSWAKTERGIQKFILAGHSLGAGACLHYASAHTDEILGLIMLSAVYNGQLLKESYLKNKPAFMIQWEKEKLIYRERPDCPSKNGYISINHLADACRYHEEENAKDVTAPVLIVCGDHDVSSTVEINRKLKDSFRGNATLSILNNCGHTYSKPENLLDLKDAIESWFNSSGIVDAT